MRDYIDMVNHKNDQKIVRKYSFINELGHRIKARVTRYWDDRKEPVSIELEGPDSISENNVTEMEARVLLKLLQDSLDS